MTSRHPGLIALLTAALLAACSPGASEPPAPTVPAADTAQDERPVEAGAWRLDSANSRLSFTSIKNNTVTEVHHFDELSGTVDADGNATLQIVLDSIRTGIDIRDQRLREMLFETGRFALATAQLSVDPAAIRALPPGAHLRLRTDVALDLHGLTNRLPAELRITRLDDRTWLVTSEQPLVVDATRFGLINGIDALRQVAGLQAIGSGIPVTLTLQFTGGQGQRARPMIPRSPARKRAIARLLFWVGWVNMLAVALVMASVLVWGRGWPSALWAFIGSR